MKKYLLVLMGAPIAASMTGCITHRNLEVETRDGKVTDKGWQIANPFNHMGNGERVLEARPVPVPVVQHQYYKPVASYYNPVQSTPPPAPVYYAPVPQPAPQVIAPPPVSAAADPEPEPWTGTHTIIYDGVGWFSPSPGTDVQLEVGFYLDVDGYRHYGFFPQERWGHYIAGTPTRYEGFRGEFRGGYTYPHGIHGYTYPGGIQGRTYPGGIQGHTYPNGAGGGYGPSGGGHVRGGNFTPPPGRGGGGGQRR